MNNKRKSPASPRRRPNPATGKMKPITIMVTEFHDARLRELGRDKNRFIRALLDKQFSQSKLETI